MTLVHLFILMKIIFTFQYDPEISIRYKSLVEKHATQFKGNNQVTETQRIEIFHQRLADYFSCLKFAIWSNDPLN